MAGIAGIFESGSIVDHSGKEIDIAKHCEGKTVGIYFSAHWCPPCRGFTPVLSEFYKKHQDKKSFEVIFVSSDRDDASFTDYFKTMPWLALAFKDRNIKEKLCTKYGIRGIPTFILVDGNSGKLITANGRSKVTDDEDASSFPWTE